MVPNPIAALRLILIQQHPIFAAAAIALLPSLISAIPAMDPPFCTSYFALFPLTCM